LPATFQDAPAAPDHVFCAITLLACSKQQVKTKNTATSLRTCTGKQKLSIKKISIKEAFTRG
jgi:hypothetical protein